MSTPKVKVLPIGIRRPPRPPRGGDKVKYRPSWFAVVCPTCRTEFRTDGKKGLCPRCGREV